MSLVKSLLVSTLVMSSLSACYTLQSPVQNQLVEQKEVVANPFVLPLADTVLLYNWQLASATNANGQMIDELQSLNEPAHVIFIKNDNAETRLDFGVGCNSIGGSYELDNNKMTIGMILSSRMYCSSLDSAEKKLGNLMSGESQLSLTDNKLTQRTADGSVLIWQGQLNDKAKYGEAETIFLEVAPKVEQCGSTINGSCLKVREVYYGNNGIKSGTGKWQLFDKTIEGYKHDANLRQILRIKKYITEPVDVKGKQLVYVLDMATEVEAISDE